MISVRDILEILNSTFFRDGLPTAAKWLFQRSSLLLRVTTLTFLLLSVLFGSIVISDFSETNRIMLNALKAPSEANPHPHSAVMALLLEAAVVQPSPKASGVAQAPAQPTTEFRDAVRRIEDVLSAPYQPADPHDESAKLERINGKPGDPAPVLSEAIVSDRKPGFLFVAGTHLPSIAPDDVTSYFQTDANYPSLRKDIAFSQKVAPLLCGGLTVGFGKEESGAVFSSYPEKITKNYEQAYLIFRSGVARLCESPDDDAARPKDTSWQGQRIYYLGKFTPRTDLHERLYFEPTVNQRTKGYFFATDPYVDLGGNSIVKTFCHYVPVDKQGEDQSTGLPKYREDAVLCFDFRLDVDLPSTIRAQVDRFGGTTTPLTCESDTCRIDSQTASSYSWTTSRFVSAFFPTANLNQQDVEDISKSYREAKDENSIFFGDIKPVKNRNKNGVLVITVPSGGSRILAVKLDLNSYQWWRVLWLTIAAGSMATTCVLVLLILADYGLKFKEQERAFLAVDEVMSDVPAPYARLDEEGRFCKVNDAFAQMLGYRNATEAISQLASYKYEQFLTKDGQETFRQIKEERKAGQRHRSYLVQFWAGKVPGQGELRWLRVHGSDVPTPHTSRKRPGQSFGILLPSSPLGTVLSIEEKNASPSGISGIVAPRAIAG